MQEPDNNPKPLIADLRSEVISLRSEFEELARDENENLSFSESGETFSAFVTAVESLPDDMGYFVTKTAAEVLGISLKTLVEYVDYQDDDSRNLIACVVDMFDNRLKLLEQEDPARRLHRRLFTDLHKIIPEIMRYVTSDVEFPEEEKEALEKKLSRIRGQIKTIPETIKHEIDTAAWLLQDSEGNLDTLIADFTVCGDAGRLLSAGCSLLKACYTGPLWDLNSKDSK